MEVKLIQDFKTWFYNAVQFSASLSFFYSFLVSMHLQLCMLREYSPGFLYAETEESSRASISLLIQYKYTLSGF